MPNPLDYMKRLGQIATTPVVDQETIKPYQDALDSPSLDRSPWEARLRGFGAGAMEGIRNELTPLNLMSYAAPAATGMALRGLKGGAGMAKAAAPTLDLLESPAVQQVAPAMDDVDSLIGDLQRTMHRVPNARPPMPEMPPAGARMPEFTPRGQESMYNMNQPMQMAPRPFNPAEALMPKMGGRGR